MEEVLKMLVQPITINNDVFKVGCCGLHICHSFVYLFSPGNVP